MNYKQMLDKFEYLEAQIAHLENENEHIRERLSQLETAQFTQVKGPGFTPGTPTQAPNWAYPGWTITNCSNIQGREFQ